MVPINNTTMEGELLAWMPAGTTCRTLRIARETMQDDCDAMFIACSQLPTRDIVEPLQHEFGRPVWSSIQATAWQTRRVLALAA